MWDEATGFYYNADKADNDFTFNNPDDLKREEIIGFLPLWAGVANKEQAKRLVEKLTDPDKFWRKYGVPSLAADDPYYNPKGYWNGPVWVEWDFLIVDGLLQYGYRKEAKEIVLRVATNMAEQLKKDHQFWEFYSPDDQWAGYHRQYIWAGIINRMLIDVLDLKTE
jgi:glycogen debranching enzyme